MQGQAAGALGFSDRVSYISAIRPRRFWESSHATHASAILIQEPGLGSSCYRGPQCHPHLFVSETELALILLLLTPKCWGFRNVTPNLARPYFLHLFFPPVLPIFSFPLLPFSISPLFPALLPMGLRAISTPGKFSITRPHPKLSVSFPPQEIHVH